MNVILLYSRAARSSNLESCMYTIPALAGKPVFRWRHALPVPLSKHLAHDPNTVTVRATDQCLLRNKQAT